MFYSRFAGALAVATAATFFVSTDASAAVCSSEVQYKVDNGVGNTNDGCQLGTDSNDGGGHPTQVNADDMFGTLDWIYAGKWERDGAKFEAGTVDIDFTAGLGGKTGTWSVVDTLFETYGELMIVTKGPNQNSGTTPGQYVGYLFTKNGTAATSGDYDTPFFKSDKAQNISHWTAYVRGEGTPASPIPAPAALPLLLTALGAGAVAARRNSRSA